MGTYMGGSAPAMARQVCDGFTLLSPVNLKRLSLDQMTTLEFELDKLPADKKAAIQSDIQAAYEDGALHEFERHSRLGFVGQEGFMKEVERLRGLGAKRDTLKTGSYPMRELAMAIKFSTDAGLDLLTIDGSGGGTGMSPWRMMNEWGIPTVYLECLLYKYLKRLQEKGDFTDGCVFFSHLRYADKGKDVVFHRRGRMLHD